MIVKNFTTLNTWGVALNDAASSKLHKIVDRVNRMYDGCVDELG